MPVSRVRLSPQVLTATQSKGNRMKPQVRGCDIKEVDGAWHFCDTNELVSETWEDKVCGYCDKEPTKEGHDGCLGTLPGVMNACCGHGQKRLAYVQFLDRSVIRHESAIIIMNELKKNNENRS